MFLLYLSNDSSYIYHSPHTITMIFFPQAFNELILHHLWGKKIPLPQSLQFILLPAFSPIALPVPPRICLHLATHISSSPEHRASNGVTSYKMQDSCINYPVFISNKQVFIFKNWIVPTILKVFNFRNSIFTYILYVQQEILRIFLKI